MGDHTVKQLKENSFDGVILSNVLDVMPKGVSKAVVDDLARKLFIWNLSIPGRRG